MSTVNLARVALDTINKNSELTGEALINKYLEELSHRVELNCMALDCQRHIIERNVDKGLLPNFSYGLVDFEHLYSTCGFLGIYETMKAFGFTEMDKFGNTYYTKNASALGSAIFDTMRKTADKFIDKYGCNYKINFEQIPGESAANKLMQKDKFFYPDADIYDLPLYGNQFIPLGTKTTIKERIRIAAEFDKYCSGGSIMHIGLQAPFDSYTKAREMVEYIADAGVTYFAFNPRIQTCKHAHAFFGKTCPTCGEPVTDEYTRIVGFYTPIKTWATPRRAEYKLRKYEDFNKQDVLTA